jgi:hypothetical protein
MLYLSSIVVILLGVICLWVSAEDPLTVSVGFSDGGFAAFQSKGNSPFYASASKDAFVINSSPDDTVVELSLPEYGKKSGTSSNPLVIAVLGLFFTATHFCLLFLTLFSFSRIGRSFPDGSAETVAKGVATHALHESFFKTSQANIEKLSIHNSDAPGTIVEDHAVVGGAMYIGGVQQWAQVAHDDFNTHGDGWFASTKDTPTPFSVSDKRQSCGNEADKHLGGYCYFGEVDVSKKYTDLPRHNFLRVTASISGTASSHTLRSTTTLFGNIRTSSVQNPSRACVVVLTPVVTTSMLIRCLIRSLS